MSHCFKSKLVKYSSAKVTWYFADVPLEISHEIRLTTPIFGGFGSVRVLAKIADISWKTSIFPDSRKKCYILPIKAEIRKKLDLTEGCEIEIQIDCEV